MSNLMDSAQFNNAVNGSQNIEGLVDQIRQNPAAFENYIKSSNPQAYQMAMQIRNSPNPQAVIMQMLQARGLNPNILNMLGLR